jgi:hypothetical protein
LVVGADEVVVVAVVGVTQLIIMEEGERIMERPHLRLVDEVEDEVDEAWGEKEEDGREAVWMRTVTPQQQQRKNRPRGPIIIIEGGEGGGIIMEKDAEVVRNLPPNMAKMM